MKGLKTGGRKLGTPNKTTKEIREHFQNLIAENIDQLNADLKKLGSLNRIKMIIELSKFVVPTLKAIESKNDQDKSKKPAKIVFTTSEQRQTFNEELNSEY